MIERGWALAVGMAMICGTVDAAACPPVRVSGDVATIPAAWRAALDELVVATSREGMPWSCPDATLTLTPTPEGNATLGVQDGTGRAVTRHVAMPADLVATGQALLAAPTVDESDAPAGSEPPTAAASNVPPPPPARNRVEGPLVPSRPRLILSAAVGPRYVGNTDAVWGGAQLRAALPLGPWAAGLWVRYDHPSVQLRASSMDLSMREVAIGLSAGRTLLRGPVELVASLDPSLAVVMMTGEEREDDEVEHQEGSVVDGRIGASVRMAIPVAGMWRATVGIDGEVAPANASEPRRRVDEDLPYLPSYTLGMSMGVEAAIP